MFAPHIRIKDVIGDGAERESRGGVNRAATGPTGFIVMCVDPSSSMLLDFDVRERAIGSWLAKTKRPGLFDISISRLSR